MAHIQSKYLGLWKPQDLNVDKISSQKMFIDNIDALDAFALSVLSRIDTPVASINELRAIDTSDVFVYHDCLTIMVKSHGIYFFDRLRSDSDNGSTIIAPTIGGGRWISQSVFLGDIALKDKLTAAEIGLGNVPNVSTNDQTPTYTTASALATLVSGEKLSISMGKIAKAIVDLISHLANKSNPHSVTKAQVGLGNVDNTSDLNKPVSTAQATAIASAKKSGDDAQTNLNTHINTKTNPHGVTASQVGLGNVPNVSTNDQTPTFTEASTLTTLTSGEKLSVLMGKIMKAITDLISHLANKSNPHGVNKTQVGLGNVDNTSDANKPVSTAQLTAIVDAKKAGTDAQNSLNTHKNDKVNPHGVTATQIGLGNVPNVSTNDQTPTYTQASTLATLVGGEKLSVSMGKIMKAITDLISHIANKTNPHSVTKAQVGLGNVDNTSDLNKPISTAMQTQLDYKAPSKLISTYTEVNSWNAMNTFIDNVLVSDMTNNSIKHVAILLTADIGPFYHSGSVHFTIHRVNADYGYVIASKYANTPNEVRFYSRCKAAGGWGDWVTYPAILSVAPSSVEE